MAFKHGKAAAVYLGGTDVSPYLNQADLSIAVDTADTTTFGSTWHSAIVGTDGAKVSFTGLYDPLLTDIITTLGVDWSLTTGVLTYCPSGAAIGDVARLVSIASTSYDESSPVGGVVAIKWDVMASAAVGTGFMLHALSTDTDTTTGASKNDLAATTTGWTAHLHVTAQNATSWVVKLQDSADNSAWADVAGGAFTAVTTKASQRLQGAAGSTLRQYVRYIATRTGGSVASTINFALAYARNN